MANGTTGSSALKLDNSERIEYLNGLKATSVWGLKTILEELKKIDGEVIKESVLEDSIIELGIKDTTDIDQVISDLEKIENIETDEDIVSVDEAKTSVVDEGKIKELVADYEKYTEEKGFSDKEALDQIYNENKDKIPLRDLENFLQKQRDIFQIKKKESVKQITNEKEEDESIKQAEEDEKEKTREEKNISEEGKIINLDKYRKPKEEEKKELVEEQEVIIPKEEKVVEEDTPKSVVEQKIEEIGKKIREEMEGNDNFEKKVEEKIKSIINEDEIKTQKEEIDELAQTMAEELRQEKDSEIEIEAKKIRIEIEKWTEENVVEVNNFRKEEFEKDFISETEELNPDIKTEELNSVREYSKLISETYFAENIIDGQKNDALQNNSEYSPGKLENSWTDLKVMTNFLARKPEDITRTKNSFESIQNGLTRIKLPNNRFTRSFENVISSFDNQGISQMFSRVQKHLGWTEKVSGWFNRTLTKTGGKLVTKVGNQAVQEFATNALGQISSMGFKGVFEKIMGGILKGGVKAAAGAGKVVAGTAVKGGVAVAGGAATGGIATLVMAALEVVKKVKKVFDKLAEKLGINIKKGLQENFGKVGGSVINGAIVLVGLPILLVGMAFATIMLPLILIFGLVFGGLFGYQTYLGSTVSTLVPPEGEVEISTVIYDGDYVPSGEPIVLPTVVSGQTVTGQMIVEMARSLSAKVCYYWGGKSYVVGVDSNWGQKITPDYRGRDIAGLDCSGFVNWVYHQYGYSLGLIKSMYDEHQPVNESDLQPGDIGIIGYEANGNDGWHVGIFSGRDAEGRSMWIHSGSTSKSLGVCKAGFVGETHNPGFTKFARVL